MAIDLKEVDNGFKLDGTGASGQVVSMILSGDDILTLARSAQKLQDVVIAKHTPSAVAVNPPSPIAAVPVHRAFASFDPLCGDILLTLVERNGNQQIFAFPTALAQSVADGLPAWIAKAKKETGGNVKN